MSMTYHHLRMPSEQSSRVAIGQEFQWVDENGVELKEVPRFLATQTQAIVLENILKGLNENMGIALLNLSSEMNPNYSDDVFVIIQRNGERLTVFSQVVPFRPKPIPFSTRDTLLAELKELYPLQELYFYRQVENWLLRADLLVYRYQQRDRSAWFWEEKAIKVIKAEKSLYDIFVAYLGGVPDTEQHKVEILIEINKLSQTTHENLNSSLGRAKFQGKHL